MGRYPKEAAVVTTRVEAPGIEVPTIRREQMEISRNESAPSPLIPQKDWAYPRTTWNVVFHWRQLFRDSDYAGRVKASVSGLQPFSLGVPVGQPSLVAGSRRNLECRILEQVQWE